jgi:hypothetical protein
MNGNLSVGIALHPRPAIIVSEGRRPIYERELTEAELNSLARWTPAQLEKVAANFEKKGIEVALTKGGLRITRPPLEPEVGF